MGDRNRNTTSTARHARRTSAVPRLARVGATLTLLAGSVGVAGVTSMGVAGAATPTATLTVEVIGAGGGGAQGGHGGLLYATGDFAAGSTLHVTVGASGVSGSSGSGGGAGTGGGVNGIGSGGDGGSGGPAGSGGTGGNGGASSVVGLSGGAGGQGGNGGRGGDGGRAGENAPTTHNEFGGPGGTGGPGAAGGSGGGAASSVTVNGSSAVAGGGGGESGAGDIGGDGQAASSSTMPTGGYGEPVSPPTAPSGVNGGPGATGFTGAYGGDNTNTGLTGNHDAGWAGIGGDGGFGGFGGLAGNGGNGGNGGHGGTGGSSSFNGNGGGGGNGGQGGAGGGGGGGGVGSQATVSTGHGGAGGGGGLTGSGFTSLSATAGGGSGSGSPGQVLIRYGASINGPILASFTADGDWVVPSSFTTTSTTLTTTVNPANSGNSVTLTASVVASNAMLGAPAGTIELTDGATVLATLPVTATGATTAVASLTTTTLAPGNHPLLATFHPTEALMAGSASDPLTQTVKGVAASLTSSTPQSVVGQSVTFTASVQVLVPAGPIPVGTIVFAVDGTTLANVPVNPAGQASFTTSTLPRGTHQVTASYVDDPALGTDDALPITQQVGPAAVTVTAIPDTGTSTYGDTVHFGATVVPNQPGSGTPTGSVVFLDGGTTLATVPLTPRTAGGAEATIAVSTLDAGDHTITAAYQGDGDYPAATSTSFTHTVQRVSTSTALSVPSSPVPELKNDTFSATVTSSTGTPTGSVTFKEGTTVLGTAELLGGTATLTVTNLPAGDHTITAGYLGDDDHAPSVSVGQVNTVWTAVHAYVNDLYLRFMGRPVDAGGLTWWTTYLRDQGGMPETVTHLLVTTSESRRMQVTRLYEDLLGRTPDAGGLAYWSQYLVGGGRFDLLQAQLLGSGEFFAAAGGTNAAFVSALFQNAQVYGRPPTAAEATWWTTLLNAGLVTRSQVVLSQLRSDAVLKPSVAAAYADVLGRGLDKSGLDFWSTWYVANRNDPWALRAVVAASLEYRLNFYTGITK